MLARMARYAVAEDKHMLGSAYWVWEQACGDPQNGIQEFGDGLMMQDCSNGGDAPPKAEVLKHLSRAYPQQAPGHLTSLSGEGAQLSLTGTVSGKICGLTLWFPGDAQPDFDVTGITDVSVTKVDGGWIITACAEGDYALTTK